MGYNNNKGCLCCTTFLHVCNKEHFEIEVGCVRKPVCNLEASIDHTAKDMPVAKHSQSVPELRIANCTNAKCNKNAKVNELLQGLVFCDFVFLDEHKINKNFLQNTKKKAHYFQLFLLIDFLFFCVLFPYFFTRTIRFSLGINCHLFKHAFSLLLFELCFSRTFFFEIPEHKPFLK